MDERRFATERSNVRPRAKRPADLERLWKVTDSCYGFLLRMFVTDCYQVLIDPSFYTPLALCSSPSINKK